MTFHNVSVIIPHHNADRFLRKALLSIDNQEGLTELNACIKEIIVVDDGSDEESWARAQISASLGNTIFVRHSKNRGQGFALNYGIDRAIGDVLMFLDADDVWMPDKAAKQIGALAEADLVVGHVANIRGAELERPRPGRIMSALAMKSETRSVVGPFREDLGAGMTIEWFDRARHAKLKMLPDLVVFRRIHGENYGIVHKERAKKEYLAAIRIIKERRGADKK